MDARRNKHKIMAMPDADPDYGFTEGKSNVCHSGHFLI